MSNVETIARWAAVQVPEPADTFRMPPHNVEAEQALLGAILVNNEAFDRVSDFLLPEHFSQEIHQRIFEVTAKLVRGGKIATPITLKTFLATTTSAASRCRNTSRASPPRPPPSSTRPTTAA